MELKINLDYKQILGLIQQLPEREKEKLAITLQSELKHTKPSNAIKELILYAPTWSNTEFSDYKNARNHINKTREYDFT